MNGGGRLKLHLGRGVLALRLHLPLQRLAARVQKTLDPNDLRTVFVIGAAAKAGRQAHLHLGIDAAGKFRIGMQVFDAAPHLEEVKRVVHELLCRHARSKRPVVEVLARQPSQSRCDRSAGEFVFQMQLDQGSEAEAQAIGVSFWKSGAEDLIEDKSRFEVGARQRVFNRADAVAQVEALGSLLWRGKQALQAPAKVGGFADVRLGVGVRAAQEKYSGDGGDGGEDLGVSFRPELNAFRQHKLILSQKSEVKLQKWIHFGAGEERRKSATDFTSAF